MADHRYGNIDSMLSDESTDEKAPPRRRRPSPAISVMTGDNKATSVTDTLKAEKERVVAKLTHAETALEDATRKFEEEKFELMQKLDELSTSGSNESAGIFNLQMPVSKMDVSFTLEKIDPELIDVSPENERIGELLDEMSVETLLESIRKNGQQDPGMVRPTGNGRYELIKGSRRLFCIKKCDRQYLTLVGDVPDADVYVISEAENEHRDVSHYEKAMSFKRQIEMRTYRSWAQLAAAKGFSRSHSSRLKQLSELPIIFVKILPNVSDMLTTYGETINKLLDKDAKQLMEVADEILVKRKQCIAENMDYYTADEILKLLKSSVRAKKSNSPTPSRPVVYKSQDGSSEMKYSVTNKGALKMEFVGVENTELEQLIEPILKKLKLQRP